MELENAVNQAKKELATRFDFKDSKAEIKHEKNEINLTAEDQFKITALNEILMNKLAKRQITWLRSLPQRISVDCLSDRAAEQVAACCGKALDG